MDLNERMATHRELIAANVTRVRERIAAAAQAAGRNPAEIKLVAVSKYVDAATAALLVDAGCRSLGEARPQQLWEKAAAPALKEAGGNFKIDYDSPLSRAQRAEEASGTMRSIENALQVVNVTQNMEPLDHFDWDVIVPELSEIQGVPARFMRSLEQIQAIRQGRAKQVQTEQMIQAAPAAASVIKAMPKA